MKTSNKKRQKIEIILSVAFILISATIVSVIIQGAQLFSSFHYFVKYTSIGWSLGFTGWLGNSSIKYYTSKKLDWTKNPKRANTISLLMYILFGLIYSPLIPYLYDLWWGVSPGDIAFDVFVKGLMIFSLQLIVVLMFYSNQLANHWNRSIEKNEELKRENLIAKFEALKNQVNPHFLFNSLNTLTGLVEKKPGLATDFIKKLSKIYRYVLEQSDKEVVLIEDEMKFVEDYLFLLKIRFGEALKFNAVLPNSSNVHVVPLGLQMLVENAIKHNVIAREMPLMIELGFEDDFLFLRNNIQLKNTVISDKKPQGLENLKKRYAYLSKSGLEIIRSESEFLVKLPIIKA